MKMTPAVLSDARTVVSDVAIWLTKTTFILSIIVTILNATSQTGMKTLMILLTTTTMTTLPQMTQTSAGAAARSSAAVNVLPAAPCALSSLAMDGGTDAKPPIARRGLSAPQKCNATEHASS